MEKQIRIVIADDHPLVRKGLKMSIIKEGGMEVVAEASDGETAIARISEHRPDIAVLDVDMPKLSGFQVAKEIQKLGFQTKTIFLTLHDEVSVFEEACDAGCDGYILKDSAMEEIVEGINSVVEGRMYVSTSMARSLTTSKSMRVTTNGPDILEALTPTERNIMRLISEGKSSKEIGVELGISHRTIGNHRTNICRKLNLDGANALPRFALQLKGDI